MNESIGISQYVKNQIRRNPQISCPTICSRNSQISRGTIRRPEDRCPDYSMLKRPAFRGRRQDFLLLQEKQALWIGRLETLKQKKRLAQRRKRLKKIKEKEKRGVQGDARRRVFVAIRQLQPFRFRIIRQGGDIQRVSFQGHGMDVVHQALVQKLSLSFFNSRKILLMEYKPGQA